MGESVENQSTFAGAAERNNRSMSVKTGRWSPIKEMLFTYLAITKILYWLNTITAINQSDLEGVGEAVLMRLLYQDVILIVSVIFFYFLDKRIQLKRSKYSKVLEYVVFYVIGFVALMGFLLIYNRIVFGPLQVDSWAGFMSSYILGYLAIMVVLNIKQYFKAKAKPVYAPPPQSTDETLSMLKILLNDNILTQEEFDQKKEKLLHM